MDLKTHMTNGLKHMNRQLFLAHQVEKAERKADAADAAYRAAEYALEARNTPANRARLEKALARCKAADAEVAKALAAEEAYDEETSKAIAASWDAYEARMMNQNAQSRQAK